MYSTFERGKIEKFRNSSPLKPILFGQPTKDSESSGGGVGAAGENIACVVIRSVDISRSHRPLRSTSPFFCSSFSAISTIIAACASLHNPPPPPSPPPPPLDAHHSLVWFTIIKADPTFRRGGWKNDRNKRERLATSGTEARIHRWSASGADERLRKIKDSFLPPPSSLPTFLFFPPGFLSFFSFSSTLLSSLPPYATFGAREGAPFRGTNHGNCSVEPTGQPTLAFAFLLGARFRGIHSTSHLSFHRSTHPLSFSIIISSSTFPRPRSKITSWGSPDRDLLMILIIETGLRWVIGSHGGGALKVSALWLVYREPWMDGNSNGWRIRNDTIFTEGGIY